MACLLGSEVWPLFYLISPNWHIAPVSYFCFPCLQCSYTWIFIWFPQVFVQRSSFQRALPWTPILQSILANPITVFSWSLPCCIFPLKIITMSHTVFICFLTLLHYNIISKRAGIFVFSPVILPGMYQHSINVYWSNE